MRQKLFLLLALLVSTTMAWADDSGTCGDGVTWTLTGTTLTISGTGEGSGAMENYSTPNDQPWHSSRSSITAISIENGVTSIGDYAFAYCEKLASVNIPSSVTSIGYQAFYNCTNLASLTIPSSVKSIGDCVTGSCTALETITVEDLNTVYYSANNAIIEKDSKKLVAASKNTVIPDDVKSIGVNAFLGNTSLTSISIPNSVTIIEAGAFEGCTNLASVTIPASVTSIGGGAFNNCSSLASVYVLATTPPALGNYYVFYNNATGRKIYVPSDNLSAYQGATFWSSYSSDMVGYSSCGDNVYYALDGAKLTIFGNGAMADYENDSERPWHDSRSNITAISIENGVTSIGVNAFRNCDNASLTSITIPSSVTSIGNNAFSGCKKLASVTFAEGSQLTTIGYYAFSLCEKLASITIPNSVTSIEGSAFWYCSGLQSITIPASVTSIGTGVLSQCGSLETITVESGNEYYISETNALIEKSSFTLISGCKNTIIPSYVTSIGSYAFQGMSGLTSITIPNSVTSIGDEAFESCTNLASVTIPSSVTSIGDQAFFNRTCHASVTCWTTKVPSLELGVFDCCTNLTIYVLSDLVDDYQAAENWSSYADNIQAIGNPAAVTANAITGDFAGNWCTYYNSNANVQVDDNTTIYTISATSGTTATLSAVSNKIIKAGEGVILKSTASPITLTYTSTAATDADYESNLLEGFDATTTISTSAYANKVIYTLAKDNGLGLYKYYDNVSSEKYITNTTLGANKAFLPLDEAASASSFLFSMDDVTDVREKVTVNSEKLATAQWYTLDGRKLPGKPSQKGIYIMNGKKVIVK